MLFLLYALRFEQCATLKLEQTCRQRLLVTTLGLKLYLACCWVSTRLEILENLEKSQNKIQEVFQVVGQRGCELMLAVRQFYVLD